MAELIVALDCTSHKESVRLVDILGDVVEFYKVGAFLFTACGPSIVQALRDRGKRVFLDLKYCDIPHTVAGAVDAACRLEVELITLHVSGGREMAAAALEARDRRSRATRVIGVTVLTSLNDADLDLLGISEGVSGTVVHLAHLASVWGLDGVVCAGTDVAGLRARIPPPFLLVCPGIRPYARADDQKRPTAPAAAVAAGADYLVVGRPVTEARDPVAVVRAMLQEMNDA